MKKKTEIEEQAREIRARTGCKGGIMAEGAGLDTCASRKPEPKDQSTIQGQMRPDLWSLLVAWRTAEIHATAIQLVWSNADPVEATDRLSAARRELRIAVDKHRHAAPSV